MERINVSGQDEDDTECTRQGKLSLFQLIGAARMREITATAQAPALVY